MSDDSSHDQPPQRLALIPLSEICDGPADHHRLGLNQDHVQHLAASIGRHGVLVPLRVRATDHGYETLAGAHRREAARHIGLTHVPCIIDTDPDADAPARSAIDNLDRKDLSPVEEAEMLRRLHTDAGLELDDIAARLHRAPRWVEDRLNMLHWDPLILEAVHYQRISKAAAAHLADVDNVELRGKLLAEAIQHNASARTTQQWLLTARSRATHAAPADSDAVINAPEAPRIIPTADCAICGQRDELVNLSQLPQHAQCLADIKDYLAACTAAAKAAGYASIDAALDALTPPTPAPRPPCPAT